MPGSSSGPVSIATIIASSPASTVSRTVSTLRQSFPEAAPGEAAIPVARGPFPSALAELKSTSIRSWALRPFMASICSISLLSALFTNETILLYAVKMFP